ncbi:MAG: DNA polymerase I [Luteibaculaceae bacterium]
MTTPNADKKLFLLDAFALIYRSYFAFSKNPRINSKGMNTSAIFGFTNTLLEVLEKHQPTHIAVVFDGESPTQRAEEHAHYKANREAMPEDIRISIPYIKKLVEAFRIPVVIYEGLEADDLMGTLAVQAERHGFITYLMTPDKDLGQLVNDKIFIYKPGRMGNPPEIMGVPEVCAKFGIENPKQVIDMLGMWGDSSDNIPGIPGVGEKTAQKLLAEYGSLENVLENAHNIKGKLGEKIAENKEQALVSKKLATIITDAPITFSEKELMVEPFDTELLKELFAELEFRGISRRLLGEEIQTTQTPSPVALGQQMDMFSIPSPQSEVGSAKEKEQTQAVITPPNAIETTEFATLESTPHHYVLVDNQQKLEALLKVLSAAKSFCFDTETTSLETEEAELVGMAFCVKPFEGWYLPIPEDKAEAQNLVNQFKPVFENTEKEIIAQNFKYDLKVMWNYGVDIACKPFDTMLAHYLLQPDMKHGMDFLAQTYLGYNPISITDLIGKKGKNQLSMRTVEPEKACEYAVEDADITLRLKLLFEPELQKEPLKTLFYDLEIPLIKVLATMEKNGIALDNTALESFSKELDLELTALEKQIQEMAGVNFNVDSPKQLGEVLFEKMVITKKAKKTPSGQYSTNEEVLQKLSSEHPIIALILDYRSNKKLKSTYVDALPLLMAKHDGRIHTTYMQTVAATGRLSSNNPNLQNIPIRTERGRKIREAFIPANSNYLLMAADYSQIELRIIAALSKDENMIAAFKNKQDIHAATASKVFNVPLSEVDREMRSKAKAVNFGIIYGQSAFGLSENLSISRSEAKEIIDNYFAQYPTIKSYMDTNIAFAREHGYVETIFGRRRYLADINSANAVVRGYAERNAINAPIQGSAADIIKKAMIAIYEAMRVEKVKSKMLLQVHDELVFEVLQEEKDTMRNLVVKHMENAAKLSVPLEVDANFGKHWLEAH